MGHLRIAGTELNRGGDSVYLANYVVLFNLCTLWIPGGFGADCACLAKGEIPAISEEMSFL